MNDRESTLLECLRMSFYTGASPSISLSRDSLLSRLQSELSMLLNTSGLVDSLDLSLTPHVSRSVVNYGIGNIAGRTLSGLAPHVLERRIRHAILTYEPRIIRHSLNVSRVVGSSTLMVDMQFIIQGQLRAGISVYPFKFHSLWDLQSGAACLETLGSGMLHG